MNLLGTYHCLPDCRPGFRVAADGAGCEGDQGMAWSWRCSWEPNGCQVQRGDIVCHWDSGP